MKDFELNKLIDYFNTVKNNDIISITKREIDLIIGAIKDLKQENKHLNDLLNNALKELERIKELESLKY